MPNIIERTFKCRRCDQMLTFPGVCDECFNKYESINNEANERRESDRLQEIANNYPKHATQAGIPPLFHHVEFGIFDKSDKSRQLIYHGVTFSQKPRGFLFLHGDTGCGKTWLAVAIARNMILEGREVWFVRSLDLLNRVRRGFKSDNEPDVLAEYKKFPILILDDLGSEKLTDWVNEVVYDLIDYRHVNLKPTIITSNLKGEEVAKVFGARIMSRIKAAGPVVDMGKTDRRIETKGGMGE